MIKINDIYKCQTCGNVVEVLSVGGGALTCCGQSMQSVKGNTTDAAQEKHVPVVEKTDQGVKVMVGSAEHPMEEMHYIAWIEIIADGKVYRKMLKPGDKPEAEFCVSTENIEAREYCNLHGLWKSS